MWIDSNLSSCQLAGGNIAAGVVCHTLKKVTDFMTDLMCHNDIRVYIGPEDNTGEAYSPVICGSQNLL